MREQYQKAKRFWRIDFDSFGEFLDYAQASDKHPNFKWARAERGSRGSGFEFSLTSDFAEAMSIARQGWPEGIALARKYSDSLFDKLALRIERLDPMPEVEGAGFDVGLMLSGVPECWVRFDPSETEGAGKIVKILYCATGLASSSTEAMIRRGAIVTALIDLLERAGHRVELIVSPKCSDGKQSGENSAHMEVFVSVKRAEQPLDLAIVAYALCHPSMMRRLGFAVAECAPEQMQIDCKIGSNYGYSSDPSIKADCDIYIPRMRSDLDQGEWWTTDAQAEAYILKCLVEQGVKLTAN